MSHLLSKDNSVPSARPTRNNPHLASSHTLSNSPHQTTSIPSNFIGPSRSTPTTDLRFPRQQPAKANGSGLNPSTVKTETGFSVGASEPRSNINRSTFDEVSHSQAHPRQESTDHRWQYKDNPSNDETGLEGTRFPGSTSIISESSYLSSKEGAGHNSKSFHSTMPRTGSIDSAISSFSATSTQHKSQIEAPDLDPASIQHLVDTAGSAENLIIHLLREKNHAASQNTQLWKLVEKQRALLFGLNQDLQRVTKDRDRYKNRLKDLHVQEVLPRDTAEPPAREVDYYRTGDVVKPPELPSPESPLTRSTQNSTPKDVGSPIDSPGPAIPTDDITSTSILPAALRPDMKAQTNDLDRPLLAINDATILNEKSSKGFQNSRKAPPKPLNLMQSAIEQNSSAQTDQTQKLSRPDDTKDNEHRGRRKTREEDDRERELSLKKEQDARSKSTKKKPAPLPKINDEAESKFLSPTPATFTPLPASPRPQMSASGIVINTPQGGSLNERLISVPLRSPGLPATPRPMGQTVGAMGSLPMSPRAIVTPLSPRAPKHPIPAPLNSPHPFADPAAIARQNAIVRQAIAQSQQQHDRNLVQDPVGSSDAPAVFRGFVSPNYPNLLLPPNALPSIQIKVASSRLRPSRNSILGLRTQEDSTIFSLSIFERASRDELWRIEKIPATLPQLDQQLRPRCKNLPRLPDRKLFSGHSPALIDARREAVDNYFEQLLDIEIDEPSALLICRYLSTDVLDPSAELPKVPGVNQDSMPQPTSLNGKVVKTGFLTKRGKNFGGWKSRYFVLDSPELRYFETPGGPHLGTIKLSQAKIGTQKQDSPTSHDSEDEYRHAFLIQEPKKKDSASYLRHVLCAESDTDRDQWVNALLHYVEMEEFKEADTPRSASISSSSIKLSSDHRSISSTKEKISRIESNHSDSPSPTSATSTTDSNFTELGAGNTNISGPINGAPIQDSSQWGNRSASQHLSRDKSLKMSNIFHFKKGSQEQLGQIGRQQDTLNKARTHRHNENVRAVFGLPLADAVRYCSPLNVDVPLPAVVYRSIEYLRNRNAANEEGLFRLSGSNIEVKNLKERFNKEGDIDLVEEDTLYDVHAVASLFKTYLRELPSPILTRDLHIEFLRVLEPDSREDRVAAFNILVHKLPPVNFALLRAMSKYLLEVTENSSKNKMSIRNMSIIFSPTVNIPTPVFGLFLNEFKHIFETKPGLPSFEASQIHTTELRVPVNLSPVDIRSPRHQMFSDIPTPAYHQTKFSEDSTTSMGSANISEPSHHTSGSGEFGFVPLQPSYETGRPGGGVSSDIPRTKAVAPPTYDQANQDETSNDMFGSLNGMISPEHATTAKQRKRESMILF